MVGLPTLPGDRSPRALQALFPAGRETRGEPRHLHRGKRAAGKIQNKENLINCSIPITWSMAGSQATPVRPLPGLPVGDIDVPKVTSGDDLVVNNVVEHPLHVSLDEEANLVLQMGLGRPRPPLSVEECRTWKYKI